MSKRVRWTMLAAVVLVSTGAWAVWDPDADSSLVFNMNFETYNNAAHTTTDAKGGLVGTVIDYNTVKPNVFGELGKVGHDANFAAIHDQSAGAGIHDKVPCPNDVKLTVPSYTGVFNLGDVTSKHTWTFWFNVPNLTQGTIIRHASSLVGIDTDYENKLWEIRILGAMHFYFKDNCLKMETASTLADLGVTTNAWHQAAVVIDRSNCRETSIPTKSLSAKIYIDGLEVPVIITSYNINSMDFDYYGDSPLWIGAGEREFEGSLDDIRLFSRSLTALEVSLLNQPDATIPRALYPIPRSTDVLMATDVNWVPATGSVTAQKVYFGTNPSALTLKKSGDGTLNKVTSAELGGPLALNTQYYWYVKSTIGGVDSNGPLWSFTSETGKALNPVPQDGVEDVNLSGVDLSWSTPTAATYAVYLSKNRSLVEATDPSVRIANGISIPQVLDVNTSSRGATYYWRVVSTYATVGTVAGDIWSFRTKPYEIVFNTKNSITRYASHDLAPLACEVHGDGWSGTIVTGSIASDGVAIFNFPSSFSYDRRYDIIAAPEYRASDVNDNINLPTPLAIHVTGDFYFDGRVQIAGDDILTTTQDDTYARSGGFPGPKHNQDTSVFGDANHSSVPKAKYWNIYTSPANNHGRFGLQTSAKDIYEPTTFAKSVFGPGQGVSPPYKGGGGGGAGGVGGDSGRGFFFGVFAGGPSYGDKEVPVPFGGSAGGWGGGSSTPGGAAGGGGIEIAATGNIVLDVNSQIRANGGSQLCPASGYPAGGGGGGFVKIIADGSVTLKGIINASGGQGGNGTSAHNTGGGGGGGRVAVFYGTGYSNSGTVNVNGGDKGTYGSPPTGLAQDGEQGTFFVTNGSPKKASAPWPKNGDKMVYCHPDPCTIKLKWYSGYGSGTDVVYCDTFSPPTTSRGSATASRGQHSVNMTVSSGNTYYWKVVTDGSVSSDIWTFKTLNWSCPLAVSGASPHVAGPEWDFNHDCVQNFEDFAFFAKNWLNREFGDYQLDNTYTGNLPSDNIASDLARFARDWLECSNRTDNGCNGW